MPLIPNPQLATRPSPTQTSKNLHTRLRRVELGDVGAWHYVYVPGAPPGGKDPWGLPDGTAPPDAKPFDQTVGGIRTSADTLAATFTNTWANAVHPISGRYVPLAFRMHPATKMRMVGHIGGGTYGTACCFLPVFARPRFDMTSVISDGAGTQALTVYLDSVTGAVIPIGPA